MVAVTTPTLRFGVPESPVAVPVEFPTKDVDVTTPVTLRPDVVKVSIGDMICAFCCDIGSF